jgi:CheY-like chemotaxis protein
MLRERRHSMAILNFEVLVVDDDPAARELLAAVLADRGAHVRTAGSAEEARGLLAQQRPDILISDLGMPREDGCEMMRHIRRVELAQARRIPAVAVTAYPVRDARELALQSGFDAVVSKPIDVNDLVSTVVQVAETAERLPAAGAVGSLVRDS